MWGPGKTWWRSTEDYECLLNGSAASPDAWHGRVGRMWWKLRRFQTPVSKTIRTEMVFNVEMQQISKVCRIWTYRNFLHWICLLQKEKVSYFTYNYCTYDFNWIQMWPSSQCSNTGYSSNCIILTSWPVVFCHPCQINKMHMLLLEY